MREVPLKLSKRSASCWTLIALLAACGTDPMASLSLPDPAATLPLPENLTPSVPAPPSTFTVEVTVIGGGSVVAEPPGGEYEEGTQVELTAVPDDGWTFAEWSGDAAGSDAVITGNGTAFIIALFLPVFDFDGDGVPDESDNCILVANADQADSDGDGTGDACTLVIDLDGDGVPDSQDNCPFTPNASQEDTNGDGVGDACTFSGIGLPELPELPAIDLDDLDGDGVADAEDNCPLVANPRQNDCDNDGIGNACDTLNIRAIHGSAVVELSDNSVWKVAFGIVIGWLPGDRVVVDCVDLRVPEGVSVTMRNLDEDNEAQVVFVGHAIGQSSVATVEGFGEVAWLNNGSIWVIDGADRFAVAGWLSGDRVVIAQWSPFRFFLVRVRDGAVARATAVDCSSRPPPPLCGG